MRKRILSLLLCCVMLIGLLPTAAFAEDSAEGPPVCSCETACTTDNMNKECPVCGAENAIPQNCGQYIPVEDRTGENGSTERADDPNGPIELSAADQVQAMIDGLPNAEEITEDNAEEVKAQLDAIDEAKEKLSDEEIDELDMTRYAEAAAALGALAAPMLLANDSPDEQFSLKPGDTYYFDLSGEDIPGTANSGNSDGAVSLPDTSLHYVPFTYVGTIEAYKLTSATVTTEEYAQQNKYPHSLFVADYAVTHTVSWDDLNTKSLIFGKNYASGGVDYTLRAPSVGSNSTGSGESQHDTPSNNEWDRILDKNSGYIQNWNKMYSWGQDTSSSAESFRAYRGYNSARSWYYTSSSFRNVYLGFRPVLEVLNPDTLGSDGMKAVTLDLNGGKLGGSSEAIQIIVKNGSTFTAPMSGGLTRPDGDTGSYFMWLGSNGKLYAPGAIVPADVTKLTAQFALSEQFSLKPGGRYYFDLSGENVPGTENGDLPDSTLHYVPFTYAGTVNAYKLTSEMATTEEYAQQKKYPHSLFVADYVVTHTVSWNDLDTASLIFGKNYASGGVDYTLRAPSVGSSYTGSGDSERGTPKSNEWDKILDKDDGYIKNWGKMLSCGQDTTIRISALFRAVRGWKRSARFWTSYNTSYLTFGFRPVLEVLNADTLGADGLKAVTLNLGGGKLGGSSDAIHIIVKNGSKFTAPASGGLTRPAGDTGSYFMWLDSNGNSYAPGASVPADVTELTVQWTAPTYTVTLNAGDGTINSGNVTSYTYGVGATLPTDVTRTGYTFKGWYDNENLTGSPVTAIGDTETGNKEYWAKWEINQYTVTVKPENGEADITITQDYGTPITAPTLTREGYQFNGWDKAFPTTMPAENLTITAQWRDIAAPTGEIKIAENDWKSFLNTITFGLFFKDTQTVTVTATDNSGETVTIEYLLSEKALAESELAGMTFTAYSAPFSINPDNEYVIYAKLTDTSGNVAYINTNGIVLDGTSPVITGIEAGKTYCAAQTITVDEKYIGTVKVNGTEVILDENGQFILSPASGEQTIVVTDKAGNETRVIVTVNDGHTYEWQSENGQYWQKCKFCNHETAKKDIPTINISGSDKVCRTQDYKFSFTLPEGATDAAYGYEFIGLGDGPLTPTVENGLYSGIIKASTYPAEENSFKLIVSAKTADGFDFSAEKTVTIQNEHTGGTATCIEQATCEICGEKYGDLKPHSYSPDWSTDETNHWHECTECRAKTDEVKHTDGNKDHKCDVCEKILSECTDTNKDHKCDLCGKTLSEHSGGKATCKDKAKCEFCGESYGELNVNNHSDLKHFSAVAATKTAEGNIEYWYCSGCKKYYKDAAATQEIKQADTVTAKRPSGTITPGADKSPQTGDNSKLLLWIALLFISGGAVTATTVYGRKKKRSVK
ncbi:InlB B-repeat-containing protein [Coprococcus sp. B2-R-112]|uniref:InlB B-repeat-containing protein n=1 Tax=Coprococcus sp. B2-R-112 TaxID=2949662 RepID=UPI00202DE748|nr:InlB B-repeat-containing protein [Coprococcus sp. B2-R-112]MCM0663981.1 InlB B-repeat-containing protein [Coprococcus sp. B2-R-112]